MFLENPDLNEIRASENTKGWEDISFNNGENIISVFLSATDSDGSNNQQNTNEDANEADGGSDSSIDGSQNIFNFMINSPGPGLATVTGLNADSSVSSIVIPASYTDPISGEEFTVSKIANTAFMDIGLREVEIPNTIKEIGFRAFADNFISSITIPDTVESLLFGAFHNNRLTSITIGSNITEINEWTFATNNISQITIPSGVTSIGNFAFYNNENLKNLVIPENVVSIGAHAFERNFLIDIEIPKSVEKIGEDAFRRSMLESVIFRGDYSNDFSSTMFLENPDLNEIRASENTKGWEDISFNNGEADILVESD